MSSVPVYRDVVCWQCSTVFNTSDGRRKYCSANCKRLAINARELARYNRGEKKVQLRIGFRYIKHCLICNEVFLSNRRFTGKYCSASCRVVAERMRGKSNQRTKRAAMTQEERDQFNLEQRAKDRKRYGWGNRKDAPQYCKYCDTEIFYPNYYCEACRPIRASEVSRRENHRKLARRRSLPHTLTPAEWRDTLAYYDNKCVYCGETYDTLHQEHFIPAAKGGGYTKDNIIPACFGCNVDKSDINPLDWLVMQDNGLVKYSEISSYLEKF
jgi:hypothetical protein